RALFLAACRSCVRVRGSSHDARRWVTPASTKPSRHHPPCRRQFLFHRCQWRRSTIFLSNLSLFCPLVPKSAALLRIIGRTRLFAEQAVLILHNEGTKTKGIAVHAGEPREPFCG